MNQEFFINPTGLKNIVFDTNEENNFRFLFGQKEIRMNRFFAEFISPLVSNMHRTDPTINSLKLDELLQGKIDLNDIFDSNFIENIKQISYGSAIKINAELSHKIRIFSMLVQNKDLYDQMNQLYPISIDETKIDSCLEYLMNLDIYNYYHYLVDEGKIFDLIASNFSSIDQTKLKKLSKSTLFSIISNPKLELENEDSLLDFINELFSNENNDEKDFNLFDFYDQISIELLSKEKFEEFINSIEVSEMTHLLWSKIKEFLIQKIDCKPADRKSDNQYNFDGQHRFEGIIYNLSNRNPSDIISSHIIEVTSSSCIGSNKFDESNVFNFESDDFFFNSKNQKNSWLCYDFKEKKVKITNYSIRSSSYGDKGSCHLCNWVIEGSNDGVNFAVLDEHEDETCLDGESAENTFEIQKNSSNDYFRYIRIRQTGQNSFHDYQLTFSIMEFFGSILLT